METNGIIVNPQSGDAGVHNIDFSVAAVNESIDKEVVFDAVCGDKVAPVRIIHEGMREVLRFTDGVFMLAYGGTFNVLKAKYAGDEPAETYTPLTYIEAAGAQYINLGYVVQEDDVIEMDFIGTNKSNADKFLFGAYADTGLWVSLYGGYAYVRRGATSSTEVSGAYANYHVRLEAGKVTFGNTATSISEGILPNAPLYLFANKSTIVYGNGYCRCLRFKISNADGVVMELLPHKRNSDGAIGLLDIVSGTFYQSESESFIAGSEIILPEGYERIEYIAFNADKLFDAGIISSAYTIESLWARGTTSGSQYMYGFVTSPHTATITAYCSSSGRWRWGSEGTIMSFGDINDHYTKHANGTIYYDGNTRAYVKVSAFTTSDKLIVGGYRGSDGGVYATFIGKMRLFRITEGDTLLKDWWPCRRLTDGAEGFWDCVTQTFVESMN